MPDTFQIASIETRFGKDFKEVLIDLHEVHVRQEDVAKALGISRQTLWVTMSVAQLTWRDIRLGLLERRSCVAENGVSHE